MPLCREDFIKGCHVVAMLTELLFVLANSVKTGDSASVAGSASRPYPDLGLTSSAMVPALLTRFCRPLKCLSKTLNLVLTFSDTG